MELSRRLLFGSAVWEVTRPRTPLTSGHLMIRLSNPATALDHRSAADWLLCHNAARTALADVLGADTCTLLFAHRWHALGASIGEPAAESSTPTFHLFGRWDGEPVTPAEQLAFPRSAAGRCRIRIWTSTTSGCAPRCWRRQCRPASAPDGTGRRSDGPNGRCRCPPSASGRRRPLPGRTTRSWLRSGASGPCRTSPRRNSLPWPRRWRPWRCGRPSRASAAWCRTLPSRAGGWNCMRWAAPPAKPSTRLKWCCVLRRLA